MIRKDNFLIGIITSQNEEEIKKIYKEWLNKWKNFYKKVVGNEKIYLEPEGINLLILNAFFTALEENLNNIKIKKNNGEIKTFTIAPNSLKQIIRSAKQIFLTNLNRYAIASCIHYCLSQ